MKWIFIIGIILSLNCAPPQTNKKITQKINVTINQSADAAFTTILEYVAIEGYDLKNANREALFIDTEYKNGLALKTDRLGRFHHRLHFVITSNTSNNSNILLAMQSESWLAEPGWNPTYINQYELETFKKKFIEKLNGMLNSQIN